MSTPAPGWYPDPNPAAPRRLPPVVGRERGGPATCEPEGRRTVRRTAARPDDRRRPAARGLVVAGARLPRRHGRPLGRGLPRDAPRPAGPPAGEPATRRCACRSGSERGLPVSPGDFWAPLADVYADHVLRPGRRARGAGLRLLRCGFLRWRGATPGKLLCGLRVRRRSEDGRLPWGTIAARLGAQPGPAWLARGPRRRLRLVRPCFLLAPAGVVRAYSTVDALTAAGARRRSIHDRVAGTVVVATR